MDLTSDTPSVRAAPGRGSVQMQTCSCHRQPRAVFAPLRLFPLHWRVRRARPGSSLAAFLCGQRRGTAAPAGGGSQFPSGPGALRLAFRLVWRPGGGGFPFSPPARSTKGVRTSPRAVSLTARPRRVSPPFPSRIPLPVGPSRQLLPCGVWRAGPCRRALLLLGYGVGLRQALSCRCCCA